MRDIEREGIDMNGFGGGYSVTAKPVGDSTLREINGGGHPDMTSGSGSGTARMVERTLANEIDLVQPIGQGRYGQVRKDTSMQCLFLVSK